MTADVLASLTGCGICGAALEYATDPVPRACDLCGHVHDTSIFCPAGHYVCDACHSRDATEIAHLLLARTRSADPQVLLERLLAHSRLPMHGPEHHAIVAGVIVAAARNAGAAVPDGALETALKRAGAVPGGWCGYCGACGAAVGVGVAVSVLTGATPLRGEPRTLALAATSFALARMLDDQPRCCKRASRTAVAAAVDFLAERLGIGLATPSAAPCAYSPRNAQCPRDLCPFFDASQPGS